MPLKFSIPDKKTKDKIMSTTGAGISGTGIKRSRMTTHPDSPRFVNSMTTTVSLTHSTEAIHKSAQTLGGGLANVMYAQPMFFSPLHTPQNWQIASKRREIYQWARFYYENEPKVAAGIDFYSQFPMNGFKLSCKDKKVLKYYEKRLKEIKLDHWLKQISFEYFLLGDVFPFIEYSCSHCFEEDALVLTDNGHKFIKDVKVGDYVLTKNKQYREVVKTISRKYSGNMVKIQLQCLPDIYSTSDHEHFVVRPTSYRDGNRVGEVNWSDIKTVLAKDVQPGDYMVCPFNNFLKNDLKEIIFNGAKYRKKNKELSKYFTISLDEDFAELMGWYVAEGSTDSNRSFSFSLCSSKEVSTAYRIQGLINKYFDVETQVVNSWPVADTVCVIGHSRELSAWFDEHCGHGSINKKVPQFILQSPKEIKEAFLRGYQSGDGHKRKARNENSITTTSKTLCYDIIAILSDMGKSAYVDETKECIDNLGIHRNTSYRVNWRMEEKRLNGQGTHKEDNFVFFKVKNTETEQKNTTVYNLTVDTDHDYVVNFVHTHNCGGSGYLPNGKECNHPDGTIKSIRILNPDWITVHDSPMAPSAVYTLEPDDELKQIVAEKRPAEIYNKLPRGLVESLTTGRPITLSNRCISHIKHQGSSYGVYGTSLTRRLFTYLAYKTKLMTANWIVAERLILPIRVVKIGNDQRPANQNDISDVSSQLAAVANDPNLTLVTHHAFEYDWIGATGKIHNITQELEQIGKEILDGFMINQAILNGEAAGYSSAQVGIEILIRRLDNWRNTLTEWVEQHILLPIAMMRGFKDEELSKETGETEWLYPILEFNDMNLRDKTNERQSYMQLHDKGLLSSQTLLESFGLNYDQEVRRKREEQAFALATGEFLGQQPPGGMGGMGGGMPPMGGGGGGGMPPLDLGGGGAPPAGGMPGGDMGMGGAPPAGGDMGMGGAPPAGGAVAAAQPVSPQPVFRVERKGKGKSPTEIAKEQQANVPAVVQIPLTGLEQKVMRTLQAMSNKVPYKLFGQFKVQVPGQHVPFVIDFAYPSVGVGVEADGSAWHEDVESQIRDRDRDQKLASVGWRILRFNEDAIDNNMTEVSKVIYNNIAEAAKERSARLKKAGTDEKMIKEASSVLTFNNLSKENIKFQRIEMENGLGHIYLVGI